MENNFIQMAASAGHTVPYTIDPIFKHITMDCVQLYFTNGFMIGPIFNLIIDCLQLYFTHYFTNMVL